MKRYKSVLLVLVVVGVSGCATGIPDKWYHAQIKDPSQQIYQLSSDMNVCMDVARGSVPMPAPRIILPTQDQAYDFRGKVTTYSASGIQNSTVRGRVTPVPTFNSGFASGYNAGTAMVAAMEQNKLTGAYVSCMNTLGWSGEKSDSHLRENGEACKASSDCEGILICQKVSGSSMQCMSSASALRLN